MVAIVAGNGLGLFNASNNLLGGLGMLGQSAMGQFGGRGYVNAVTGNLVLQAQDEVLSGRGADLLHLRTYNSLGQLTDGDADNWRWDGERTLVLTGTMNAAGSKVTRTAGDGSVTEYAWNGNTAYTSHDGAGADDTLTFDSTAQQWVFIDGSTRREERYSGPAQISNPARLVSEKDTDGNVISFGYAAGRLTSIIDNSVIDGTGAGSKQKILLTYGTVPGSDPGVTRLLKMETFSLTADANGRATSSVGTAVKQVDYNYDSKGRLTSVVTDLTPLNTADNASGPGTLYTTKYTYVVANSTDTRIASIAQSDGTAAGFVYASFTYEQAPNNGPWRIKTVTDGSGTQTFTYNANSTDIKFSDDAAGAVNARTWTYTFNSSKQLIKVESPPPVANAARLVTQFEYDSSGNITRIVDARGFATTYKYDVNGNRTRERDAEGNTISRTYSATNQLLTETHYKSVDANGDDDVLPADPLTTRFVYDTQGRLRFTISAEGRVAENRYGTATAGFGLLTRSIRYAASRYDVSGLTPTQVLTEANLTAWLALSSTDKSQVEQSVYEYDLRGNLSRRTDYAKANTAGDGVLDAAAAVTDFVYDGHGMLLQTIAVRGASRDQRTTLTSFTYDGMGRVSTAFGSNGTRVTTYDDVNRIVKVSLNGGPAGTKDTISTYDTVGRLIGVSETGWFTNEAGASVVEERPATTYQYDAQGRLRMVQDGLGARRFSFYDDAGRVLYEVDSTGAVKGYEYNGAAQVTRTTLYATRANASAWVNGSGTVTKSSLVPGADFAFDSVHDRITLYGYDDAGRLETQVDAANVTTVTTYDGASRVTQQQTGDRVTRYLYDRDGRQVGVVDPLGYLTEKKYDAAGRLVETVRYTTRSPNMADVSAPVWSGVTNQTAVGTRLFVYHLPAAYDADGDAVTYSVVGTLPAWLSFDAASLTLSGTPPKGLTSYDVTLRASDGRGPSPRTTDVTVRITVVNSPPAWGALPDLTVSNLAPFSVQLPAATDIESTGAQLTYSIDAALLPPGVTFNAATRTLSGTPTVRGTYNITVRVSDGGSPPLFTEKTFVLQVTNLRPSWNAVVTPLTFIRDQGRGTFIPGASDPDDSALQMTYRIVSGPSWLQAEGVDDGRVLISGTAPLNTPLGLHTVVLEAQDRAGETVRLTFSVSIGNVPPVWGTLPAQSFPAGSNLNYTPPAAGDVEGSSITYSMVGGSLPPGVTVDPVTGRISGPTGVADIRGYTVVLRATDAEGGFTDRTLVINLVNTPPAYSHGLENLTGFYFNWIGVSIPPEAFFDVNGDPVTLSIDRNTPGSINTFTSGLVTDPVHQSGLFFAPWQGGAVLNYRDDNPADIGGAIKFVTINATDSRGGVTKRTISITVQAPPPPPPPPPGPQPGDPPTGPTPGGPTGGGGGGGLPPHSPPFGPEGGTLFASPPPITRAPDPVFSPAPEPLPAMAPAPAPLTALNGLAPIDDVLAPWRPSDTKALHSYQYYDGQGRVVGSVDERGFLSETVYDAQNNTSSSVRYMSAVTVGSNDTLSTLKPQAGAEIRTVVTAYDSMGRVSTVTDTDGTVTRNEYDALGRMVRQVLADGTSDQRATRIRYNVFGEVSGTLSAVGDAWLAAHSTSTLDQAIDRFGMRYEYNGIGERVKAIDARNPDATQPDASGNSLHSFYDSAGRLTHTVNAKREVTEILYNAFGEAESTRQYSISLTATQLDTALSGAAASRGMNTALLPLLVRSNQDRVTSIAYDKRGLVESSTDALGFVTSNTYTAFGQLETQVRTLLNGATPTTTTTRFAYDLNGQLLAQTADLGGLNFNTQMAYDAYGRVIRTVDAAGKITTTDYDRDSGRTIEVTDPLNRKVRTEYDAFNRVLKVTDAAGKTTIYAYDDANRSVSVTTPPPETGIAGITVTTTRTRTGEIRTVVDGRQSIADATKATISYTYDADGRLATITDALGRVIAANSYDNRGRLDTTTDARGIVTRFTYDELNRVVTRQVDPTGLNLTTQYEFDVLGRQIKVTEGFGTSTAVVTAYAYDLNGQLTQVLVDPVQLKLSTTYSYDGLGNVIQVAKGIQSDPNRQVTQYLFDKLGRRVKEIAAPSAIFGAGSSRALDLTTEYRYDAAGRVSRRIDANGQSAWFVYDDAGQLKQTINALGEVSENAYDLNGRIVQTRRYVVRVNTNGFGDVVGAVSTTPRAGDQRSYFVYDALGRQRFSVQAENMTFWTVSENRYDANGNVIETRRYEKRINDADSDAAKVLDTTVAELSLTRVQDVLRALGYKDAALGGASTDETTLENIARTRFAYDANDRLRFAVDALGGVSETTYDAAGNVLAQTRYAMRPSLTAAESSDDAAIDGKVDRANQANQVTRFAYDNAGRLRYTLRQVFASSKLRQLVTRQTYDATGHVVRVTAYAAAAIGVTDFSTAALDTLTDATAFATDTDNRTTAFAYDTAGRQIYSVRVLTAWDALGALTTNYLLSRQSYDSFGNVIATTAYATPLGSLSNFDRSTLDAATSVAAVATHPQNRVTRFAYDLAGRLRFTVAADGSFSETVYDALGQVTERRQFDVLVAPSTQSGTYSDAALSGRRAARAVGDGVTRGERYTYDAVGRVLSVTDANNKTEYNEYDGLGNRIKFTDKNGDVNSDTTKWLYTYDRLGRVSEQFSPAARFQLSNETTLPATPRSLRTQFQYDAFGNLTAKVEAVGTVDMRATEYAYDTLGRRIKETLPGYYDTATGAVVAAPASGGTSFRRTLETSYDALGNAVRSKLRTGVSSFQYEYKTYDALGRIGHDVDALGNVTAFSYNSFDDQVGVTRFSKSVGAPPSGVDVPWTAAAVTTALGSDSLSRTVSITYDTLGRKTDVFQPAANRYFFSSAAGNEASTANAASIVPVNTFGITRYEYNAFGDVIHEALKVDSAGTDATGRSGHWRDNWHYHDTMGREVLSVDAGGYQTVRSYDELGNLKEVTEYANPGVKAVLQSPGLLTALAAPAESSNDRITAYTYDALNRQLTVQRKNVRYTSLQNDGTYAVQDTGRANGVVTQSLTYDALGHVKTQTDASNNITTNTYDALGRLITVTAPAWQAVGSIDPFHNQVSVAPVTTFTYDAYGQVLKQETPVLGFSGSTEIISTQTRYDLAGNAISVTDARGNVKNRRYDYAGRLSNETQAIVSTLGRRSFNDSSLIWRNVNYTLERRYAYDALGRQVSVTDVFKDAAGVDQQSGQGRIYNAFGEVTDELRVWGLKNTAAADLKKARVAHYEYDAAGNRVTERDADGVTEFYYNLAGQVTRQEQKDNSATADGSVTRITETGYGLRGYAIIQRLAGFSSLIDGASQNVSITPVVEQAVDRWGNVVLRIEGGYVINSSGVVDNSRRVATTYEYNHDNQVIAEHLPTVTAYRNNGTSYQANVTHELRYDKAGRVVQELDTVPDQMESLRTRAKFYDSVGHLIAETDATQRTTRYAYNSNGNRVGTLTNDGTVFLDSFDQNGNLIAHNLLRKTDNTPYNSFSDSGSVKIVVLNRYEYDAANRRVASQDLSLDWTDVGNWTFTEYDARNLAIANFQVQMSATPPNVATDPGRVSTSTYDVFGNKTDAVDVAGNAQHWNYNWVNDWSFQNDPAAADYTVGRLTSTVVGGKTTTYTYTDFGQVWKEVYTGADMTGGSAVNDRVFAYFENGLLKSIDDRQSYGAAGTQDYWNSTERTLYAYNAKGQLINESFHHEGSYGVNSSNNQAKPLSTVDRWTTIDYDALGRITRVSSVPPTPTRSSLDTLQYRYDELGNRREILADYTPRLVLPQTAPINQGLQHSRKWYDYDKEGRMTVVDGEVVNDQYVIGHGTTTVDYDDLGRRRSTQKWDSHGSYNDGITSTSEDHVTASYDNYRKERYTYNELNYLTQVEQAILEVGTTRTKPPGTRPFVDKAFTHGGDAWVVTTTRNYNLLGEVLGSVVSTVRTATEREDPESFDISASGSKSLTNFYDARGFLVKQATQDLQDNSHSSIVINNYDDSGLLRSYQYMEGNMTIGQFTGPIIALPVFTNTYNYEYSMQAGGLKEKRIVISSSQPAQNGSTNNRYDARGNLVRQTIDNFDSNRRQELLFAYDSQAHVIAKDTVLTNLNNSGIGSGSANQDYFYAMGQALGLVGSGDLMSTTQFYSNFTPVSAAYPRSSPGSYTVQSGDTLAGIAQLLFGDSSLWYLIADANGLNVGPTQSLAGDVGKSYHIPNVVANVHNDATTFKPYNASAIIGSGIPAPVAVPPPPSTQCITGTQIAIAAIVVAVAVAASIVTYGAASSLAAEGALGTMAAAGIGAAAGSAAAQLTTIALTDKTLGDFSGMQVLEAGIAGAVGGFVGLNVAADFGNAAGQLSMVGRTVDAAGNFFTQAAVHSLIARQFDTGSLASLGSQVLGAALVDPVLQKLDTASFKFGTGLGQLAVGAVGPAGWVYNDDSRTWSRLISEAVNAATRVSVGGVYASLHARGPTQATNASPVWIPDETGDWELGDRPMPATSSDAASLEAAAIEPDAISGAGARVEQTYVIRKGEHLEHVAQRFLGDRRLGTAIAIYNGVDPLNVRVGQQITIPLLSDLDIEKSLYLNLKENQRERAVIFNRNNPDDASLVELEVGEAVERAAARDYHLRVDGIDSDALVSFRPGFAADLRLQSEVVSFNTQELQLQQQKQEAWDSYIDKARIVAEVYDVPLEFVLNDDYKPSWFERSPPVQLLAQVHDMGQWWNALHGEAKYYSEYARGLQIDLELNKLEGNLGFSRDAWKAIATQVVANASVANPYTAAAFSSYSIAGLVSHGINEGFTGSDLADIATSAVWGGLVGVGLSRFGRLELGLPSVSRSGAGISSMGLDIRSSGMIGARELENGGTVVNPTGCTTNCVIVARVTDQALRGNFANQRTGEPWAADAAPGQLVYPPRYYKTKWSTDGKYLNSGNPVQDLLDLERDMLTRPNSTAVVLGYRNPATATLPDGTTVTSESGHAFNAVNYRGSVSYVDGQSGEVLTASEMFDVVTHPVNGYDNGIHVMPTGKLNFWIPGIHW